MITIDNLHVSYGQNEILKGLNASLETGCVHGIVGLNGSGKTTLLRTLMGYKKASIGSINCNNKPLTKKLMAYVESDNYFMPYLTAAEHLKIINNNNFDTDLWSRLFNLPLNEMANEYSSGMKKKLAILMALKLNRSIFIMDEPFNGLDLESVQILKQLIISLKNAGYTLLITSHIIEVFPDICDYIIHLQNGKIEHKYTIAEFGTLKTAIYGDIQQNTSQLIEAAINSQNAQLQ